MLMKENCNKDMLFEQLFKKYYHSVYEFVVKRVINHAIAEDLTMDVFLKCWEKYDDFDSSKASFSTWIFVVTKNKLKNYYRDKKIFEDIDEQESSVFVDDSFEEDMIEIEYYSLMRKHLACAFELLSEEQQRIVFLKYYCNKNAVEIANELHISSGNVRVKLSRSIAIIRAYFMENNIKWER